MIEVPDVDHAFQALNAHRAAWGMDWELRAEGNTTPSFRVVVQVPRRKKDGTFGSRRNRVPLYTDRHRDAFGPMIEGAMRLAAYMADDADERNLGR